MRINIDITEKMEEIIRDEVRHELKHGGLLRFIRECTNNKITSLGLPKSVQRHEAQIRSIRKKLGIEVDEE